MPFGFGHTLVTIQNKIFENFQNYILPTTWTLFGHTLATIQNYILPTTWTHFGHTLATI
jgi:hypothetical protein